MERIKIATHGYVDLLRVAGPRNDFDITDVARSARVSFNAKEDYPRERALRLVSYLWKHRHTTPFEMIQTWWEIKAPIFVARQLMRHRTASINEVSRRYVTDPVEMYMPDSWRQKSAEKKQGSADEGVEWQGWPWLYLNTVKNARSAYEQAIEAGVCPEQARMVLPLSTYTRWEWRFDLHNLLHMIKLRIDPHAQKETREFAMAMLTLLGERVPDVSLLRNEEGE